MKKLFIIPILFTFAFSQNKSNQISYTIETTSAKYYMIDSIELINNEAIKVYDSGLQNNFIIPIAEIKTLSQNGWKTNDLATFIFTIAGGASGSIAGIFIDIGLFATPWGATNDWQALIYLVSIGGGARIGYKLGKSIFKRRYKALEFEGLTLDKKINYLMSLVNK